MRRVHVIVVLVATLALPGAALAIDADALPDTVALTRLSPEELFLRASSAALQFETMRQPSRRILVRNHEESLSYLVTQLDTDDARERHALEDILVKIGEPAVDPLIDALRREARREDTTRGVRLAALVLGRLGDPSAVRSLTDTAGHDNWKVRGSIAGALGRIGTMQTVPTLVVLLRDTNEIVRKGAAVALRRVGETTEDTEELAQDVAGPLVGALSDRYYAVRESAADAIAAIGEPALDSVTETAERPGGDERLLAIRTIGKIGSRGSLGLLKDLLESDDWTVRAHAAEAIGAIGPDGRSRRMLRRMLESEEHPFVRLRAEEALAEREG